MKNKENENPPTKSSLLAKKLIKGGIVVTIVCGLAGVSLYENYPTDLDFLTNDTDWTNITIESRSGYVDPPGNLGATVSPGTCKIPEHQECSIQCTQLLLKGDEELVYGALTQAWALNLSDCTLQLSPVNFKTLSIESNWLKILPNSHPKITTLDISYSNLAYIGPGSFTGFPDLEVLCIVRTDISYLARAAFSGMPNLQSWNFRENSKLERVEHGLLSDLPNLHGIQIQDLRLKDYDCSTFFKNLTGSHVIRGVSELDFRFNCLVNITTDFFKPFPLVTSIFLENNGIRKFEEGSLDPIINRFYLYLENNELEELPENVFGRLFKNGGILTVDNNNLNCDCDMKWLQDLVKNKTVTGFNNVYCSTPEHVPFWDADMCSDSKNMTTTTTTTDNTETGATTTTATTSNDTETGGTTTTTIGTAGTSRTTTTSKSTTVTTTNWTDSATETDSTTVTPTYPNPPDDEETVQPDQIVEIKCTAQSRIAHSRIVRSISPYSSKYLNTATPGDFVFTLAPKTQHFRVSDSDDGTIKVTFEKSAIVKKNILWITYEDDFSRVKNFDPVLSNCSTIIPKDPYFIKNLEPSKSYLICVSNEQDSNVNLLDCVPHTTKALPENQAWLTFGSKPMAVFMVVGVTVGAFLIGCGILYFLVRKNPTLIQGSKSVIVVKRQEKKQVMIMPKDYDTSTIKTLKRKISDSYSVVSYISAIQPSQEELLSYRLEMLKMKGLDEKGKLMVPNLSSTPRSSVKTTMSDYTIYENDFELPQNCEREY